MLNESARGLIRPSRLALGGFLFCGLDVAHLNLVAGGLAGDGDVGAGIGLGIHFFDNYIDASGALI